MHYSEQGTIFGHYLAQQLTIVTRMMTFQNKTSQNIMTVTSGTVEHVASTPASQSRVLCRNLSSGALYFLPLLVLCRYRG